MVRFDRSFLPFLPILACAASALGCSSSSPAAITYGDAGAGSAETPPITNGADVEAWLKAGYYKQWHCESTPHPPRGPSPHTSYDRVCSNSVVSPVAAGTAPWPPGAASVKELYVNATDPSPGGYAVAVKTQADSAGGANWYWYERQTGSNATLADGFKVNNCVPCHGAAGSDAAHTTSTGSRDFVYTPVP